MKNFNDFNKDKVEAHYYIAGAIVILLSIIFSLIFNSSIVVADDEKNSSVKVCQKKIISELERAENDYDFISILKQAEDSYTICKNQ